MTTQGFRRSPLDPERVLSASVTHWQGNEQHSREDSLTVEEPLEIRLDGRNLAVIMRTPGSDRELTAGFLFSEGVISGASDILDMREAVDEDGLPLANVIDVALSSPTSDQAPGEDSSKVPRAAAFERHFAVSASCGLCGKDSIADVMCNVAPLSPGGARLAASTLYGLPEHLRQQQAVFTHTGGLHAAGLFARDGELLLLREDVGRHNAVDKLIGHGLLQPAFPTLPYEQHVLMVSGRTSFEIIQKALLARIPCVASISAPSSLAVELAETGGITLVGFLRDRSMNVYTHPERIV
jgi:FdhD protein